MERIKWMYRTALAAATILALPLVAEAQPIDGLYIGGGVGWNYLQSEQLKNISAQSGRFGGVSVSNRNVNFGSGIVTLGSVGWGFGNGLRAELEGNFRDNASNQNGGGSSFAAVRTISGGGETKTGAMVNAFYDFTDAFGPGITPYVGVGVGWQYIRANNIQISGPLPAGPGAGAPFLFRLNNGTNAFAYQAILGASYTLSSIDPGLALTAEYRYMGTGGNRTYKAQFFAPQVARGTNIQVGMENNQAIILGVRYAFNTPPPAPAPAPVPVPPAPAPSRTYLIFFDWDRADLTPRARQVVSEAAQASTHVQYTRIEVNGYTDASGTAKYNQELSVRRAHTVGAELIRDGVPEAAITVQGFGETHPLIPTAAGVREPQNRRVEIIIR
jgi:OmpA-OmpF porin, OOP family